MSRAPSARGASFVEISLLLVAFVTAGGAAYRVVGKTVATRANDAATAAASSERVEETTVGIPPHDHDRE